MFIYFTYSAGFQSIIMFMTNLLLYNNNNINTKRDQYPSGNACAYKEKKKTTYEIMKRVQIPLLYMYLKIYRLNAS